MNAILWPFWAKDKKTVFTTRGEEMSFEHRQMRNINNSDIGMSSLPLAELIQRW